MLKDTSKEFSAIQFNRGLIFSFEEFLHEFNDSDSPKADFSYVTGCPKPIGPFHYVKRTVINDLAKSEDDILGSFNDSTRNYINNVVKKDLCSYKFMSCPTESDLESFEAQAQIFARKMGIPSLNSRYLRGLNNAKRANLSYVLGKDGSVLAGHAYRLSDVRPELLFSFRPDHDAVDREKVRLLSRANRYHHYRDMLQYKSWGYEEYDFGGLSDGFSDNVKWNYIDEFKMYFGGSIRGYYNSILYNTFKSKAYRTIRGSRL